MKESVSKEDLLQLLLNAGLAIIVLIILIVSLETLGLIEYTVLGVAGSSVTFMLIALSNVVIRAAEANRLGYEYYYEHSLAYAILSFILTARFYGFFPVLYLGGTRLKADRVARVGTPEIGTHYEDLYHVAHLPLFINTAVCLLLIPVSVQAAWTPVKTFGLLLAAYTFFSTMPWPYSNGLHILIYNQRTWAFLAASSLTLVVFYAII